MGTLNTTPRTWVAGAALTAAQLNAEIRDALTNLQSAWTSYTPTLSNITLGNGSAVASFQRVGKTITATCLFQAGSSTAYSAGTLAFSLPVTPSTNYTTVGNYAVGDAVVQNGATTTRVPATAFINTSGNLNFMVTNAANTIASNTVPGTFGTSAVISWTVVYQAA